MATSSLTFLQELIARWKSSSPKFFKTITTIAAILAFVVGIPDLLQELGIVDLIPEGVSKVLVRVVSVASTIAAVLSKLTVDTPQATESVLEKVSSGVKPEDAKVGE